MHSAQPRAGGYSLQGAQGEDPDLPNYEADAPLYCSPPHEVDLDSFFISKYELTQSQWFRIMRGNPSYLAGDGSNSLHPVESITWHASRDAVARLDLELPTEARWECAAKGGGDLLPHWIEDPDLMWESENWCDRLGLLSRGEDPDKFKHGSREDGWEYHAPVGEFLPNPYGLYDSLGNISEWCADVFTNYDKVPPRPGDGLREDPRVKARILRGGCYSELPGVAGATVRDPGLPSMIQSWVGVRPARSLVHGGDQATQR